MKKLKTLKYGQLIKIERVFDDQQMNGIICAKGFVDNSVNVLIYDLQDQLNNYRETLFQILPRGSFEIHDEYFKKNKSERKKDLTLK